MKLTYDVDVDLVVEKPTKITPTEINHIKEVILTGKNDSKGNSVNGLTMDIILTLNDEIQGKKVAEDYLGYMKRIFYFEEYKVLNRWNLQSFTIEKEDSVHYGFNDTLAMIEAVKIKSSYQDLEHLKSSLEKNSLYQSPFLDLYMSIIKIEGDVGKYIMTYSILSAIIGNQREVDEFIQKCEDGVEMKDSTLKGSNKKETIYTYLRNQLGHTEESTNADELEKEIKKKLSKLSGLAMKAILNK